MVIHPSLLLAIMTCTFSPKVVIHCTGGKEFAQVLIKTWGRNSATGAALRAAGNATIQVLGCQ
jgi:hypothetical protein